MTVAELIEKLQEMPKNLEVMFLVGGMMEALPVNDAQVDRDRFEKEGSKQVCLLADFKD